MKIKTTLAVIALSLAPGMALAGGDCHGDKVKAETAASCIPGATWDEEKGACVTTPTS
jgi:hypothetical protein